MVGYHGASAVEECILINDKGACGDVAGQFSGGQKLQLAGGSYVTHYLAGKDYILSFDISFNLAFRSENQVSLTGAVAGDLAVDSDGLGRGDVSFKDCAGTDDGTNLGCLCFYRRGRGWFGFY